MLQKKTQKLPLRITFLLINIKAYLTKGNWFSYYMLVIILA